MISATPIRRAFLLALVMPILAFSACSKSNESTSGGTNASTTTVGASNGATGASGPVIDPSANMPVTGPSGPAAPSQECLDLALAFTKAATGDAEAKAKLQQLLPSVDPKNIDAMSAMLSTDPEQQKAALPAATAVGDAARAKCPEGIAGGVPMVDTASGSKG